MKNARIYHTLTMLADGTVFSAGGNTNGDQVSPPTGVLPAEIWNPTTQTWTAAAPMAAAAATTTARSCCLTPRCWSAGGGHSVGLSEHSQYSGQIYSPPYLFKGARPVISSAPPATTYGSPMTISTPQAASIASVNLVSLGADTHQIDMDQHFVPLAFTAGAGSLTVQTPASSAVAPPGDYMVFVVDSAGVPSVASMVHVSGASDTTAPTVAMSAPCRRCHGGGCNQRDGDSLRRHGRCLGAIATRRQSARHRG